MGRAFAPPFGYGARMDTERAFLVCTYGVMPAWLLLAFAPTWPWTQRLVHSLLIPLLLVPVYVGGLVLSGGGPEGSGFGTLLGVMALFTDPLTVLAGWVHYLIFDLFIGAWEVRDAHRRAVPHGYVIPCLFLTLMVGPVGLAAYLLLRLVLLGKWRLAEELA